MKKILFFSAAAALMLASCANEETVQAPKGNAIDFGNAFVNNSTRADIITDNLTDFAVYGYMNEVAGVVFNNEKVSGSKATSWNYDNTQYWTEGKNYWFAAIAPYEALQAVGDKPAPATFAVTNLPEAGEFGTIVYDNSNQLDLLYANKNNIPGKASGNAKVAFTFNHLLARTQFTFTHAATNNNVKFHVSAVKIADAVKEGTITLGENAAWTAKEGDTGMELSYSTTDADIVSGTPLVSGQQYIIPIAKEYNVTFKVAVYNGSVLVGNYDKTVKIPATVTFARGNSYNFTCGLTYANVVENAEPIKFDVTTVTDWNNFGDEAIVM